MGSLKNFHYLEQSWLFKFCWHSFVYFWLISKIQHLLMRNVYLFGVDTDQEIHKLWMKFKSDWIFEKLRCIIFPWMFVTKPRLGYLVLHDISMVFAFVFASYSMIFALYWIIFGWYLHDIGNTIAYWVFVTNLGFKDQALPFALLIHFLLCSIPTIIIKTFQSMKNDQSLWK